ncbi:HAD-IA family hydrolase [Paenibacillus mucilaginosus]|uniref:REG-2-like, HAD superfamily (Subfamily IA) hydrolase n=1 Tax=Paenibacillus mucilaginosus (strain KNP414) TaxID=1036673 RepID=F8FFM0_PAEMK|nr:HAD-IA family hydrolase [Paenibacillus mucilaginosus]AEI42248.1 REG-2-like, HAD superfamily (subfamily IA) hydrolase [Paenibacillus mucilaginosus KNP414]MCG7214210.1 HAD-IA family hydrolase [Paenibacillus mucilaginosus]WDM28724.1 HAD-IA family hydrolase [Paenibacillus mucilaginosus]
MALSKRLDEYKAVFFDVGDTLLTIPAAQVIMGRFLAARDFHPDEARIGELFTEAFRLFYYGKEVGAFEACTPETDRQFWIRLYGYILEHLGVEEQKWTPEQVHACCHELYDLFTSPEHYSLFADVQEVLASLQARGLRLGVISNFAPTLPAILESKGILHFFDPVVVSTLAGLEKPDPAIFTLALKEAGLHPSDVLYVGDHDINDVWAPNQVGIDAVKILRYEYHSGAGIRSLRELLDS